jgi:DNA polymerase-3 subunit delta
MIGKMLEQWSAEGLSKVAERAGKLERGLMFNPAPQQEALGEELLAIAREARRR